jgi:pimeloyl-ACP methyl ester carboxylesterase
MGGKAAMYYSAMNPEQLNGLVIFDIAPVNYPDGNHHVTIHRHILESMNSISPEKLESREEAMELLGSMLPDIKLLQFLLKNLTRNTDGTFRWMLNIPVLLAHLDVLLKGFTVLPEPIAGFPVIFARGEKSDYVIPPYFSNMKSLYPAHELVDIPDAGHWLHQEQPALVTEVLMKLMNA